MTASGSPHLAPLDRATVQSGGSWKTEPASPSSFIPVPLANLPVSALRGIPVYIRVRAEQQPPRAGGGDPNFRLYCARHVRFTAAHLNKLTQNRVNFLYIPSPDHRTYRVQVEQDLEKLVADRSLPAAPKSTIIYETGVELLNELLTQPDLSANLPRLDQVSHAVASLVITDPQACTHLFAAAHHDFYTATHMVNVGAWMACLAHAMGTRDQGELAVICQAGMLHDIGKLSVPQDVLNKKGTLTAEDWAALRAHPAAGYEYLSGFEGVSPIVKAAARQHHERMDGSGYPDGLKGDQVHPISRLCAVVDSFDAMTAVRPFKHTTLTVVQAVDILLAETPTRYDPVMVEAWVALVRTRLFPDAMNEEADGANRRTHRRSDVHCPARVHRLLPRGRGLREESPLNILAHSISVGGLGFLCQYPIRAGDFVRIYLDREGWRNRALEGQVVRCRAHSDTWHEIGVVFCDAKAAADEARQVSDAA